MPPVGFEPKISAGERQGISRLRVNQSSEDHLYPVIRGLNESQMSVRIAIYLAGSVTVGETDGLSMPACSTWSFFSLIYLLVKGPGLAQYEATISVKVILVYVYFKCFLYNAVHVSHVLILSCH